MEDTQNDGGNKPHPKHDEYYNRVGFVDKDFIIEQYQYVLPEDFFIKIVKEEYHHIKLYDCIFDYYQNKTSNDLKNENFEKLKSEFIRDYEIAIDKQSYVKRLYDSHNLEDKIYKYKNDLIETRIRNYSYEGYGDAILGINYSIEDLLDDDKLLLDAEFYKESSRNEKKYFYRLHEKLQNLIYYISGYARACFLYWIKYNYSLTDGKELSEKVNAETVPFAEIVNNNSKKSNWLGTPAQFGFIINELVVNGYLENPFSSHAKNAEYYLSVFEIKTTPATLAKELSNNTNSISPENALLLRLPDKNKLK